MPLRARLLVVYLFLAIPITGTAQESGSRVREISHVSGDLYKVIDGDRATVFLVSDTAILIGDALSPDTLRWLREQLEERYPGRPVRYVVLSSHRYERVAGAGHLAKEAEIVAHEAFSSRRASAANSLPPSWAVFDRNQDNALERSEFSALGSEATAKDLNNDGRVTPAEAWSDVSLPESTYRVRRVIALDDRRVALIHPGDGLGADLTILFFPKERVVFAPDVPLGETPMSFDGASPAAFAAALSQIEAVGFDTIISGSGETYTLADLAAVREYVQEMVKGVRAGIKSGHAVEQLQTTLQLERFGGLRNFGARRGRNIEEVFRGLRLIRVGVSGTAQFMHLQRGTPACSLNAVPTFEVACEGVGGPTISGAGSIDVMVHRIGGAFEMSRSGVVRGSDQRAISRPTSFESRETVFAFMVRYDAGRALGLDAVLTGGLAQVTAAQRVNGPNSFWFPSNSELTTGTTATIFGVDLTASRGRFRVVMPVRVMREPQYLFSAVGAVESKWSVRAGIGIGGIVARVVR
jgi:hypothetical protein